MRSSRPDPARREVLRGVGMLVGGLGAGGLAGGGALSLLGAPLLARSAGASLPAGLGSLSFEVMGGGSPIGRHTVTFETVGGQRIVDVAIDLAVRFAFVTVYRYSHRAREVWEDGRLVALDSETDDDGKPWRVTVRQTAEGLAVSGGATSFVAPPDTLPTSYWNPRTVEATRLIDSQKGRLFEVAVERTGSRTLQIGERSVAADVFAMTGDLNLDIYYADDRTWLGTSFSHRGLDVAYEPDPEIMLAALDGG